MTGSGRAGTARERREPATPPTPAPGPRPPASHVSAKMAALGREAGADPREKGVVPVGAGEMPKVGGETRGGIGTMVSAASWCWRTLLK